MQLKTATQQDISSFARALFHKKRNDFSTFEEAAQFSVKHIYESFLDDVGEPMFALVRVFRACTPSELPPEQDSPPSDDPKWLALFGTVGTEPAWNDRLQSIGHRIIPAGAFSTPMLKASFEALGFASLGETEFVRNVGATASYTKFFHVEEADGSPYIVAQDEFVKPYGIQSVIGIGSPFASGAFYMCLGFSKKSITNDEAQRFSQLSPFISTLLANYDSKKLWNDPKA